MKSRGSAATLGMNTPAGAASRPPYRCMRQIQTADVAATSTATVSASAPVGSDRSRRSKLAMFAPATIPKTK